MSQAQAPRPAVAAQPQLHDQLKLETKGLCDFMPPPPVLNVGFYNYVLTEKVVAMVSSDSAPMRRLIQKLKQSDKVIDATHGRKTKSVIFTSGSEIVLSAISQETLAKRLASGEMIADEE